MTMKTVLLAAGFAALATSASAVTIDFDDAAPQSSYTSQMSYSEDGFDLTSTSGFGLYFVDGNYDGGSQTFTSDFLHVRGMTVEASDGSDFSFSSVDLRGWDGTAFSALFTGTLSAGGTVSETVSLATGHDITTVLFDTSWTGLSSLEFATQAGRFSYINTDNYVFNAVAPVPLPASDLMLGAALGGLAVARRRKTA